MDIELNFQDISDAVYHTSVAINIIHSSIYLLPFSAAAAHSVHILKAHIRPISFDIHQL